MKPIALMTVMAAFGAATAVPSQAEEVFTGDTRLACEAVLCLATGQRPNECRPSLQRYFSIKFRKPGDTIRGRVSFLKLCPMASQSPQMASLVSAMGAGAGSCDPASLNIALQSYQWAGEGTAQTHISNALPAVCKMYIHHAYTDQASLAVRYVGKPERGGYWIEAAKYDAAQAVWITTVAAEDAAVKAQAAADLQRY